MRSITVNILTFDELSDSAKETARQEVRNTQQYFWIDEAIESLEQFALHFGAEMVNYDIDFSNSVQHGGATFQDNHFLEDKEIETKLFELGTYNKETLRGDGDCKLTGACFDEDAIDGFRKAWFDGERDLIQLLKAGYNTWFKSCVSDYEHQLSDEGIAEHFEANSYEFTEDGKKWKG